MLVLKFADEEDEIGTAATAEATGEGADRRHRRIDDGNAQREGRRNPENGEVESDASGEGEEPLRGEPVMARDGADERGGGEFPPHRPPTRPGSVRRGGGGGGVVRQQRPREGNRGAVQGGGTVRRRSLPEVRREAEQRAAAAVPAPMPVQRVRERVPPPPSVPCLQL